MTMAAETDIRHVRYAKTQGTSLARSTLFPTGGVYEAPAHSPGSGHRFGELHKE